MALVASDRRAKSTSATPFKGQRESERKAERRRDRGGGSDQWAALAVVFHLNLLHLSNTSAELSDVSCGDIVIELSDGNLCAAHGAQALARGGSQSVKDRHWSRGWRLCLHWQRDHNWARCPHWRRCSERFPGDEDWLLGSLSRRRPRGGLAGLLEGSCRWLKRRLSLEFRILLLRMVHLCCEDRVTERRETDRERKSEKKREERATTLGFIFACDDFIERQIQTIHRRERAAAGRTRREERSDSHTAAGRRQAA
jgi:hypothetical protein